MEEKRGRKFKIASGGLLLTLSFLVSVFFNINHASAASLYFSPRSGTYAIGKSFSVSAYVSSADTAANAFQATINFPQDKLQLTSLSKSGSIISLWVQEPSYSNSDGTASFAGVVPNPGYTGSGGRIITLTFKVKSAGNAQLSFSDGSVLANDGQGTNILTSAGTADFTLGAGAPPTPAPSGGTAAPKVSSPTHPNSNKWYANSNPKFQWDLPGDVTGVSYLITASPSSNPGSVSDGLVGSKSYSGIADGSQYFHIRFRNSSGWGPITHFKFQIDTVAPTRPNIGFLPSLPDNPNTLVNFQSTDDLSGLAYYEVAVGDATPVRVDSDKVSSSSPYELQSLDPGKHLLVVKAYDFAGNYSEATAEFTVTTLEPPKIDKINDINEKELLHISGQTYPDSFVDIYVKDQLNNTISKQSTKSNDLGFFNLVWPDYLSKGQYEVSGTVTNGQGDKSPSSVAIKFSVTSGWLSLLLSYIINFLSPLFLLFLFLLAVLFLLWYLWHRFHAYRRKVHSSLKDTEADIHKAFDKLKESVRKRILLLEKTKSKRELTAEEDKIMRQLRTDLEAVEKTIDKQIERLDGKF